MRFNKPATAIHLSELVEPEAVAMCLADSEDSMGEGEHYLHAAIGDMAGSLEEDYDEGAEAGAGLEEAAAESLPAQKQLQRPPARRHMLRPHSSHVTAVCVASSRGDAALHGRHVCAAGGMTCPHRTHVTQHRYCYQSETRDYLLWGCTSCLCSCLAGCRSGSPMCCVTDGNADWPAVCWQAGAASAEPGSPAPCARQGDHLCRAARQQLRGSPSDKLGEDHSLGRQLQTGRYSAA